MTFTEWGCFFIIIQAIHFLGTWKLYEKAGRKVWEAAVPFYSAVVLMRIINRPTWWVLLLFVPVINLLMFMVIWIETIRSFKFYKRTDSFLVIATLGLYIFYVNYATDATYNTKRSLKPRSEMGEWVNSITFAIIAATFVHTYFMQPFTIPSSSLEKSLLVGDYLFVSKFHYGARIPSTTIAAPMVHDSIYLTKKPSYLKKPQLPYMRLPGFQKIKNNEIVCFNWPADSLKTMWGDTSGEFTYKPVDKKTNYVKRAVGIAGDTLELKDGYVYINGKKNDLPDRTKLQYYYTWEAKNVISTSNFPRFLSTNEKTYVLKIKTSDWENIDLQNFLSENKIHTTLLKKGEVYTEFIGNSIGSKLAKNLKITIVQNKRNINLTDEKAALLRKHSQTISLTKVVHTADNAIFPHIENNQWSQDNMGPLYIPEKGATVELTTENLPYYWQIIKLYEYNDLESFNGKIYSNGSEVTSYTFQQDYFWLMGDNRHNSLDSRYWGFVPFDHVLGKPVMVWFSWNANAPTFMAKIKSIRWDRMFSTVHGDGEIVSHRYWVLGLILMYFAFNIVRKRRLSTKK